MDERESLQAFVDEERAEVRALLDGVTEEQARERKVASKTTLLALVKHAAFVERTWFLARLPGVPKSEVGLPDSVDESFDLADSDTVASVVADFDRACAQSREVLARHQLDDAFTHPKLGTLTVRWIMLHLIREHARHAGHGDILREQIIPGAQPQTDGLTPKR